MKKYIFIGFLMVYGGLNAGAQVVWNNASVTIQEGAMVHIQGDVTNAGTLENSGFVNAWQGAFSNTGTLVNKGLIDAESANGLTAGNEEMVILPITMPGGLTISPTFTLAQNPTIVVNGIFSDTAATISAGDFTQSTNTFAPLANTPQGTTPLFASVLVGNSVFVAPFNFTLTGVISSTINAGTDLDAVFFPNPTTDRLFVKTGDLNRSFWVFNSLGQVMKVGKQIPGEGLDVSAWASGTYHFILGNKSFVFQKI
jgi:hypothetical protein